MDVDYSKDERANIRAVREREKVDEILAKLG